MTALYFAHSGLRYLVLLFGLIALLYSLYAWFARRPEDRISRISMMAFVGALDLQIILGIVLVALGVFYPALMGHMTMMIVAAVVAHAGSIAGRRGEDPRRGHMVRFATTLLTLLIIVAGISAIGRGIFETRAPMLM